MTQSTLSRFVRHLRTTSAGPADRELLARYTAHRDDAAFAALVRRHGRFVLAACRQVLTDPADIDDAFQATFLVLLRKANSVNWQESLGGWLFAVAHRVAVESRKNAGLRRAKEARAAHKSEAATTPPDLSWREAVAVLHEELDRLPDDYRRPLLLCYLDGQSREEAAQNLGWTAGAVKGCLERGRQALAKRLARRGISLSAGLLAAAGTSTAHAAISELVPLTVWAAAGGASATVLALAGSAMPSAVAVKQVLLIALALGLVAFGGVREQAAGTAAPQERIAAGTAAVLGTVRGHVLTPDGQPAANAAVYLRERDLTGGRVKETKAATTGPDGRFEVRNADWATVAAFAEGFGPAWAAVESEGGELTLRLAADIPIRGRLLDLEGKPVAAAKVRVLGLHAPANGDLGPAYDAFRLNPEWTWQALPQQLNGGSLRLLPSASTAADGTFEFHGLGVSRVVEMRFEADGIESARAFVFTDPKFDTKRLDATDAERRRNAMSSEYRPAVYGPTFTHAARPGHDISGTVNDAETGKPVAGVTVVGTAGSVQRFHNESWYDSVEAVTGPDGRYRLTGLPKAAVRFLHVKAGDRPYLDRLIEVKDVQGLAPVVADIRLFRAAIVEGRLLDAATGQPVKGVAFYLPLANNVLLRMHPDARLYGHSASAQPTGLRADSDADGRFRLRVPLGPGVILARSELSANPTVRYAAAAVADAEQQYLRKPPAPDSGVRETGGPTHRDEEYFDTEGFITPIRWENGYVLVSPKGFDTPTAVEIRFNPGRSATGRIVDPDSQPLAGTKAVGLGGMESRPTTFPTAEYTAYALDGKQPRTLYFIHETRKLAGTVTLRPDDKEPPTARLRSWAAVTGRLLDHDGKPVAGAEVWFQMAEGERDEAIRSQMYRNRKAVTTGADGRFVLEGLFPDFTLTVIANKPGHRSGISFDPTTPRSGETKDLGEKRFPDPKASDQ